MYQNHQANGYLQYGQKYIAQAPDVHDGGFDSHKFRIDHIVAMYDQKQIQKDDEEGQCMVVIRFQMKRIFVICSILRDMNPCELSLV